MCRYSHVADSLGIKTRKAEVGEQLIVKKFSREGEAFVGFGFVTELETCACLLPGTKIRVSVSEVARQAFGLSESETAVVTAFRFADGLRFENERVVELYKIGIGAPAEVLELPAYLKHRRVDEETLVGIA